MKRLDLVGHRFERLLVFALKEINKKGNTVWECRCDCGASVVATGTDLKTNRKRSCGCLKSELLSEFRKLPPGEAGANSLYAQYRKSAHYRSIGFSLTITEFKYL